MAATNMLNIDDHTPVSDLVALKKGDEVGEGESSGKIASIDFEETNNYWEMILMLDSEEKIYVRRQKTMC